jgi:hypothetical protein
MEVSGSHVYGRKDLTWQGSGRNLTGPSFAENLRFIPLDTVAARSRPGRGAFDDKLHTGRKYKTTLELILRLLVMECGAALEVAAQIPGVKTSSRSLAWFARGGCVPPAGPDSGLED